MELAREALDSELPNGRGERPDALPARDDTPKPQKHWRLGMWFLTGLALALVLVAGLVGGLNSADPPENLLSDFGAGRVETLLNALIALVDDSLNEAKKLKDSPNKDTLVNELDKKVKQPLLAKRNALQTLKNNPPKSLDEWKLRVKDLAALAREVKALADYHQKQQQALCDAIAASAKANTTSTANEKQVIADLLKTASPPVLASLVEYYARERCGLTPDETEKLVRPILDLYVKAHLKLNNRDPNIRRMIDRTKFQKVHDALLPYVQDEAVRKDQSSAKKVVVALFGHRVDLTPKDTPSQKEARERLRALFDTMEGKLNLPWEDLVTGGMEPLKKFREVIKILRERLKR